MCGFVEANDLDLWRFGLEKGGVRLDEIEFGRKGEVEWRVDREEE